MNEGNGGRETPQSSSGPTGLGRGLSGILGDVSAHRHGEEVSALLGSTSKRNSPEVRRIVAELAVDTMSSAFRADGVLMARLGRDGSVDPLRTRLADTWPPGDALGFEVNGRLWNCLTERTSVQGQVPIGRLHVLFARHKIDGVVVATAVVRSSAFSAHEQEQLAGLIRSAARCTEVESTVPAAADLHVDVAESDDGKVEANVRITVDRSTRSSTASGVTKDQAVASAAVAMLDGSFDLRFAGSTLAEDDRITIVVLNGAGGTVFGLAVTAGDSCKGAAEAAFSAAASGGLSPTASALPA